MERSEQMRQIEAEQIAVRNREVTIIMPHYVVPPECAAHCRHLRRVARKAILRAVAESNSQIVVICTDHRRFGCNAYIANQGGWDESWGDSKILVFRGNPSYYEGLGSVSSQITGALSAGAQDYDELPPL